MGKFENWFQSSQLSYCIYCTRSNYFDKENTKQIINVPMESINIRKRSVKENDV